MKKDNLVALVACSNPYKNIEMVNKLKDKLGQLGFGVVVSKYLDVFDREVKSKELNEFFNDDNIKMIFDISGGDLANELLDFIDYENINKPFFGYSDLTTIVNAINKISNKETYLYQIRNIIYEEKQFIDFKNFIENKDNSLFEFEYQFIRGERFSGKTVGGNIRCLLKLAGSKYWPDFKNKVLILEAYGGNEYKLRSYFSQLKQLNVFNEINGIILGTFSEYEGKVEDIIGEYLNNDKPIVKTEYIGHNPDSKAVIIGKELTLKKN